MVDLGLQWVSSLMLGLDCGGFSGGSFDFVVFLVEGLILSRSEERRVGKECQ